MASVEQLTGIKPDRRKFKESNTLALSRNFVGVEIEAEGFDEYPQVSNYWDVKGDGSLRDGGIELVFSSPLYGEDMIEALHEAEEVLHGASFSERTSVHVHLDVRDMSLDDLFQFTVLYLIFERALVQYHGGVREDNIFALPFYRAEGELYRLNSLLNVRTEEQINRAKRNMTWVNKYSAFNMASLFQFGSIEFRHQPGTNRAKEIIEWINIIFHLKRYAVGMDTNIRDIPELISVTGPEEFAREVFGSLFSKINYPLLVDGIYQGIRLAQDAIFYDKIESCNSNRGKARSKRYRALLNKFGVETEIEEVDLSDEGEPVELVDPDIVQHWRMMVDEARQNLGFNPYIDGNGD